MKYCIGYLIVLWDRILNYFKREYSKKKFAKFGSDSYIGKNCIFTYSNIEIGNDTYVGSNCIFQSTYGKIKIGNHVMFGPGVNIHGGNHKIREIGKYMKTVDEKKYGEDGIIVIEDDCWIGANAIILSNVKVGRGSVIGAGSVVTKNIPPYSIYTGVPAMHIRERFSKNDLKKHMKIIDSINEKNE